jgi:hypothetical protein
MNSQNKIEFIKNFLQKNKSIIEENRELFSSNKILRELSNLNLNIQTNKLISTKNQYILDLLSIPYNMIQCFKNNCLSVYLEYYAYVKSIKATHENEENLEVIKLIHRSVDQVNKSVSNLITKMLEQDNSNLKEFNLDEINDLLNLKMSNILDEHSLKNIENSQEQLKLSKQINLILYQVSLFYHNQNFNKNTNLRIIESFFDFIKEKCNLIKKFEPLNYKLIKESAIFLLIENYLLPIIKNFYFSDSNGYSIENYVDRKNKIIFLLKDLFSEFSGENILQPDNQTRIYNNFYGKSIKPILDILIEKFYSYLDYLMNLNITSIKKYLLGYKDIKKFLSASATSEISNPEISNNGLLNILKFEILLILKNNLTEIFNSMTTQNPNFLNTSSLLLLSIKEKNKLLIKFNEHIETLIGLIQIFFDDNMYILKYDSYSQEIELFKSNLFNFSTNKGIFLEYTQDLYSVLGLNKLWENKVYEEKRTKWGEFLSDNLDLK